MFRRRDRESAPSSSSGLRTLLEHYENEYLLQLSESEQLEAWQVTEWLNQLLVELIYKSDLRRLHSILQQSQLPDPEPAFSALREGQFSVAAVLTPDAVNACIRPAPGGYLIEIGRPLYMLISQQCACVAASINLAGADAPELDAMDAQSYFAAVLRTVITDGEPFPDHEFALSGLRQDEYAFYFEMSVQFAIAHELSHLILGHLGDAEPRTKPATLPSYFYSANDESDADGAAAVLVASLFDGPVPTAYYGPILLFALLDAIEMARIGLADPSEFVSRMRARAVANHPHPSLRIDAAIRVAFVGLDEIDLGMCDRVLTHAEIVDGYPMYTRDYPAAERLYGSYDMEIREMLIGIFQPPWSGKGYRRADLTPIIELLDRGEDVAMRCLATTACLFLDQIQDGLRVISTRIQIGLSNVYVLFHERYILDRTPSPAVAALDADFLAAVPDVYDMVWLFTQTATMMPKGFDFRPPDP